MNFYDHLTFALSFFFRHYKHWFTGLITAVLITSILVTLRPLSFMQVLEAKTLDARFGLNRPPEDAKDVVMIGIDDASLKFFGDNGISWPWPRSFYAHVVDYLTRCGARAVLFDLLFYQPDLDRSESDGRETDNIFAQSIANNGHVVLGAQLSEDTLGFEADLTSSALPFANPQSALSPIYRSILAPVGPLAQAASSLGIVNIAADPDGIIRKAPLVYSFKGLVLPQITIAGFTSSGHQVGRYMPREGYLEMGDLKIPVDRDGYYHVYWYGRESICNTLECVSFAAVIQSASADVAGEQPALERKLFKDKFVVIGATAAGLMDLKPTPAQAISPGMEIWATILLNFIHGDFFHSAHWLLDILRTIFMSYAVFWLLTRFSGLRAHIMTICLPLLCVGESIYFWRYHNLAVSLTLPLFGFIVAYSQTAAMGYIIEGRSKRQISRAMSRYLHPDLVKIIADDPDRVEMGGSEIDATVLFSDIYNFTTISENFTPHELVTYLNHYFSDLSGFVLDHGGMLDKYTGDGIMALFGAPLPRDDHALLACRAALAHRNFSRRLSEKAHPEVSDKFHQGTRIGLHSGKIVAGNIGSTRRMDYTAIGDTVNLAARLEGVNKIYKTQIIISESCYQRVRQEFICRELDYLRVKGKKEPTRIFELIDEAPSKINYAWIKRYEQALEIYRQGDFTGAAELFAVLADGVTTDSASAVMLERCRYLSAHPPESWDGILTLEVK